ncbi:MAG: UbiA family prenyltransferase, partial [Chloroflexota bacterium]|nr:UbiA family prenyltransferase [Chloroflexota bacterium]
MTERQAVIDEALGRYNRYLAVVNDYITLTKPPIILLLLITAAGGMFLAAQGLPSLPMLGIVWIGGALASAGANALNHQLDRDIDAMMTRTSKRPVA